MKKYFSSLADVREKSYSKIFIFYSDIQIKYRPLKECKTTQDINNEKKNIEPILNKKCLDLKKREYYYNTKKTILDEKNVKIENIDGLDDQFFNTFFFSSMTLQDSEIIKISSAETLGNFEDFISHYKSETKINSNSIKEKKILSELYGNIKNEILNLEGEERQKKGDMDYMKLYGFCDENVEKIILSIFLHNKDLNRIGSSIFLYSTSDTNVQTYIKNYSSYVENFGFTKLDKEQKMYKSVEFQNLILISIIFSLMLLWHYLKNFIISKLKFNIKFQKNSKHNHNKINESTNYEELKNKEIYGLKIIKEINKEFIKNENQVNNFRFEKIGKEEVEKNINKNYLEKEKFVSNKLEYIFQTQKRKNNIKSISLFIAFIIFIIYLIFKFIHFMKSTRDYFFTPKILLDLPRRDSYLFYNENLRIFMAIIVIFLYQYLIFVFFPLKRISIIRKFNNKSLIIFWLTLITVIFSITIFFYVYMGIYFLQFNQLFDTLFWIIGFCLGIDSSTNFVYNNNPKLIEYIYILKIIVYFLRLVVTNFTLIVMYNIYKKDAEKLEKKDLKKLEIEKEKRYLRIKAKKEKRRKEKFA
jgi:hypothetical protein